MGAVIATAERDAVEAQVDVAQRGAVVAPQVEPLIVVVHGVLRVERAAEERSEEQLARDEEWLADEEELELDAAEKSRSELKLEDARARFAGKWRRLGPLTPAPPGAQ